MNRKPPAELSRRERQMMQVIYTHGEASAAQVLDALPDPPSYSAVRALLAILVQKSQIKRRAELGRYIYSPTRPRAKTGRSAMVRVLETFYGGSLEKAVAALLQSSDTRLSAEELARPSDLIDQARQEGR